MNICVGRWLAVAMGVMTVTGVTGSDRLYDFEGDTGTVVVDKLDADGNQNAALIGNVFFESDPSFVLRGDQSVFVDIPDPLDGNYSSIELDGTADLGSAFTVSAFINFKEGDFTRLFTSYPGSGGVPDGRVILDMDPSGTTLPGFRFIIGGHGTVTTPGVPEGLVPDTYLHVAATYDDGAVAVYLNGQRLELTADSVPGGPMVGENLRFGEDLGGTANEQFIGNVDDILVVGRALSETEIAAIAADGVTGSFTADDGVFTVYYDFEGDADPNITDKFIGDGENPGIVHNSAKVDPAEANARWGSQSGVLALPNRFSQLDAGNLGTLGRQYTLAALVNVPGGGHPSGQGLQRLFSTYPGGGSTSGRLIFDFDPNASGGIGMRLLVNGSAVMTDQTFSIDETHHLAAVYDDGSVALYLDGAEVATGTAPGGDNLLDLPLRIAEDSGGALNEQLLGTLDDLLVLRLALTPEQVEELAGDSAASFVATLPTVRILSHPADLTVEAGKTAVLSVDAIGSGALSYQWFKDGDPVDGATEANLTLTGVVPSDAGSYHVVVQDEGSQLSSFAGNLSVAPATRFDLLLDFEEDLGDLALDKITADGINNGNLLGNVTFESDPGAVLAGAQSARFEEPVALDGNTSSIEIPETADLGTEFTLAVFADFEADRFFRMFTSYEGGGSVQEGRVILDVDPRGSSISGVRLLIGGHGTATTTSVPAALNEPGYHHVAATYNDGAVAVYIDGVPVELSTDTVTGGAIVGENNLRFGEDVGGSANEQFNGRIDDVLVITRALGADDIAALAASGVAGNVTPADGERAVHYDFEGDPGEGVVDRFTADGGQDGFIRNVVHVEASADAARFGNGSAVLANPQPFSLIQLGPVGLLGSQFTFSAVVNVPGGGFANGGLARLFTTYAGGGSASGRFIFDFNPAASVSGIGMRFLLPDGSSTISDATFTVDEPHLLTGVFDRGAVRLYLDGVEVEAGTSPSSEIDLGGLVMQIGEDLGGGVNEQLVGVIDDVLILSRALTADQVAALAMDGAEAVVNSLPTVNIWTQPVSQVGVEGDSITFSVVAIGEGELTYQWMKDGVDIDGATGTSLTLPDIVTADAAEYTVLVSDAGSQLLSAPASLTIEALPSVNIWLDFEDDTGTVATDKITEDGAQNGRFLGNAGLEADPIEVMIGEQSARFGVPEPLDLNISALEMEGTTQLGLEFTLAAHVKFTNNRFTRLFTSFAGTGGVPEGRVILDMDPSGNAFSGLRFYIGAHSPPFVTTTAVPEGLTPGEYHHVAATYNDGAVAIYLDGVKLALTADSVSGGEIISDANMRFGEDVGGALNEQFDGNVDEILVLGRALEPADIAALASGTVTDAITPESGELAVYYNFENDSGSMITDVFADDGEQNGIVHNEVSVDENEEQARFGVQSAKIGPPIPFSVLELDPIGNLGRQFTIGAYVNVTQGGFANNGIVRLFSNYPGGGSAAGRFIFDFNPNASGTAFSVRVLLPDGTSITTTTPVKTGDDHLLAAVYDNGTLTVYVDGEPAATGVTSGSVDLGAFPLRIGEDLGGGVNEQLLGFVDNAFLYTRSLSAQEIKDLAADLRPPSKTAIPLLDAVEVNSEDWTVVSVNQIPFADFVPSMIDLTSLTTVDDTIDDLDVVESDHLIFGDALIVIDPPTAEQASAVLSDGSLLTGLEDGFGELNQTRLLFETPIPVGPGAEIAILGPLSGQVIVTPLMEDGTPVVSARAFVNYATSGISQTLEAFVGTQLDGLSLYQIDTLDPFFAYFFAGDQFTALSSVAIDFDPADLGSIGGVQLSAPPGLSFQGHFEVLGRAGITGGGGVDEVILLNAQLTEEGLQFEFDTVSGTQYIVEYKDSILDADWTEAATIDGDGSRKSFQAATDQPSRYFRVRTL